MPRAIDTAGGAVLAGLLPRMAGALVSRRAVWPPAPACRRPSCRSSCVASRWRASIRCNARWPRVRLPATAGRCLPADALAGLVREIGLEDVVTMCRQMQQGAVMAGLWCGWPEG